MRYSLTRLDVASQMLINTVQNIITPSDIANIIEYEEHPARDTKSIGKSELLELLGQYRSFQGHYLQWLLMKLESRSSFSLKLTRLGVTHRLFCICYLVLLVTQQLKASTRMCAEPLVFLFISVLVL